MNDRRRFLHVLGATSAAVAFPACGGDTTTGAGATGTGGSGGSSSTTGSGGAGGTGGTGASTGETTTATASSSTGGGCEMNPVGTAVGVPADFADFGLHKVKGTKVLIGRDGQGLYALTSICPHEFFDMDEMYVNQNMQKVDVGVILPGKGILCAVHGSKYDNNGAVVMGPANKPLKAYAMVLGCDGKLYVDKTKQVANTQRLDA
jgi:nitrite reductase/ring-hydroxylating ferredoxin subunit